MLTSDLPNNLKQHPLMGQWLRFSDGRAQIFPGKVEIGQGIVTALVQIAAQELGLAVEQVQAMPASTAYSPNEAVTSGSLSVQECGYAIRHVCALARSKLLDACKKHLVAQGERERGPLRLERGQYFQADGSPLNSYWDEPFAQHLLTQSCLTFPNVLRGETTIAADALRMTTVARLDFPAKFSGQLAFVQDMRLANMRFAFILRGAGKSEQRLAIRRALTSAGAAISGGDLPILVEDGAFTALICGSLLELARYQGLVDQAIAKHSLSPLAAARDGALEGNDWMVNVSNEHNEIVKRGHFETSAVPGAQTKALSAGEKVFEATFDKPWLSHASIGLSCALACFRPNESLQVWTHSQGIFNLRSDLVLALGERTGLREDQFIVQHVEGAGCYGHNGADDVAFDAARVAMACPGTPVRVQWTRAQELACAPFSPAMRVKVSATLSAHVPPNIKSWIHSIWSNGHSLRPGRATSPTLLGSTELKDGPPPRVSVNPTAAMGYGAERNALPLYAIGDILVENYRLTEMPIRASAFRGLGAIANVFAIESMMDDMARSLREDPLEFRLRHLPGDEHQRARAVLRRVASLSSWTQRAEDSGPSSSGRSSSGQRTSETTGFGLAFARYKNTGAWCAVVAQVELTERVQVRQLWVVADVGRVVNEDGVRNQLEGAAIQSTSIALLENAQYASNPQISPSWDQYPILKFSDVPVINIELIAHQDHVPSLGAGEPATAPVVAAIANAVASVIGVAIHRLPLTPETIAKTIELS